jgi:hypothetical protein
VEHVGERGEHSVAKSYQRKHLSRHPWKWFGYQLTVTLVATTLIVTSVYTPPGGWTGLLQKVIAKTLVPIQNESIRMLHRLTNKPMSKQLTTATGIQQPLPQRPSYSIQARLDTASHTIHSEADIWIPNLHDTHVRFYLFTENDHPIQVKSVTFHSKNVPFSSSPQMIDVQLPSRVDQAILHLVFDTPILQGGYRYGEKDNVWTIGYWYPILGVHNTNGNWSNPPQPQGYGDPFLEDNGDYDITWTAPASFHWYTTGPLLVSKTKGTETTYEWKIENVRNFALVGSPRFHDHSLRMQSGTILHYATLDDTHDNQLATIIKQATDTYTERFGSYYYPEFSVVETPAHTVFAQEYPGIALFSADIWSWTSGEHWIAHEIAHGWWYHSVGDYESQTEWLDEGLAEYSSLLYIEHRYGIQAYLQEAKRLRDLWKNQQSYTPNGSGTAIPVGDEKVDQPYTSFQNQLQYYYATYLRTTVMYLDLRDQMGDKLFFDWLQQYYLKNAGKVATRTDLTNALQDVGRQFLPRLNQWLDTPNAKLIQEMTAH